MALNVVTRFAPSPTGYLHIGGARTALFNWLYAKANGGKMLLRIEDTDQRRSTDEAIDKIYDSLKWLGLEWDDDAVSQKSRQQRHVEIAQQLLATGHAYHCYCSPQELEDMRNRAMAEKRPVRYDGTWRDREKSEAPADIIPVIRFKAPQEGETVIDDQVQSRVVFNNRELDDLIILRSDGTPTYNLSVVVDDHDMAVSHIIRGVDHLTNTARQTLIYQAMGWPVPVMAHIPLIHGADGAKLSKRHGALGVEAYRDMGYLPAALRNYLARLGWSHGDEEVFSTEQMIEWFDLDAVGKSAARFDFTKLENLNGHYIRHSTDDALFNILIELFDNVENGAWFKQRFDETTAARLKESLPGLKERAKTMIELMENSRYIFARRPLVMNDKAAKLLTDDARALLGLCAESFANVSDWQAEELETALREVAEKNDLKLGKVAQPLRAALTGTNTSPGIFDVIAALGRDESLARIQDQVSP